MLFVMLDPCVHSEMREKGEKATDEGGGPVSEGHKCGES